MGSWASVSGRGDSRGNRLLDYHASQLRDRSTLWFDLKCCDEVADVIFSAFSSLHPNCESPNSADWTHHIRCNGPYVLWMRRMLDLFEEVLVLRTGKQLALTIALDFYKVPPTNDSEGWANTRTGRLVNRKYWKTDPRAVAQALDMLAGEFGRVIDAHPWYKAADVVVSIPGSEHTFGEQLAAKVTTNCRKPLVRSQRLVPGQGPAKAGHASPDLQTFALDGPVDGKTVVIVDDVYKSGITMCSVAAAASALGATRVPGLLGARTMQRG